MVENSFAASLLIGKLKLVPRDGSNESYLILLFNSGVVHMDNKERNGKNICGKCIEK